MGGGDEAPRSCRAPPRCCPAFDTGHLFVFVSLFHHLSAHQLRKIFDDGPSRRWGRRREAIPYRPLAAKAEELRVIADGIKRHHRARRLMLNTAANYDRLAMKPRS